MPQDTDIAQIHRLALTFMKGMDAPLVRNIVEIFGDISCFFDLKESDITEISHFGAGVLDLLSQRKPALEAASEEYLFMKRHGVRSISILDEDLYPARLAECEDAPLNLFMLGSADLNAKRILSVVGTRKASPYGVAYTSKIVEELHTECGEVTIVSGLAYGIDKAAHDTALRLKLPTIAVMAHGLGMVYPAMHRQLAADIIRSGGAVISEYPHSVTPLRPRFLARNRIVAGVSDGVFVVESPKRSGALNTAAHARGYNREVGVLPGRAGDEVCEGSNALIAKQLGVLVSGGRELANLLCWQTGNNKAAAAKSQPSLFDAYEGNQKEIYDALKASAEPLTIDALMHHTGLSVKEVMSAIGELDFDGVILRHPGAKYSLI